MPKKIGLSNFNNIFNKDESKTKIEEAGSTMFFELIQYLNSNFFYIIICSSIKFS